MRDLTKNERLQRAIGGLKMLEAFVTNLDEEHISDTACEEFDGIIKDVEAVEEQLREEEELREEVEGVEEVTFHLPDGFLGAVKHDDEREE